MQQPHDAFARFEQVGAVVEVDGASGISAFIEILPDGVHDLVAQAAGELARRLGEGIDPGGDGFDIAALPQFAAQAGVKEAGARLGHVGKARGIGFTRLDRHQAHVAQGKTDHARPGFALR